MVERRPLVLRDDGSLGQLPPGDAVPAAAVARAAGWAVVTDHGAVGNGTTDSAAAINAAISAVTNTGGTVFLPAGAYLCETTIVVPSGVHLRGAGIGGDIYSATDTNVPYRGTVLRLKTGANVDLVRTANFATLTGQQTPSSATTPSRFGLHDLVLDGNKAGNTSGWPLRIFGRTYQVDRVVIQNGAAGGAYSEYGAGGYEMEAQWSNFQITDCAGPGLDWRGPHDSLFSNGTVARNDGQTGIHIDPGAWVGGELFTNVHVWGDHAISWTLGLSNSSFVNCVSDGGRVGVRVLGSGNTWVGGSIFGTSTSARGEVAIQFGDGTTRTTRQNTFLTRIFNYARPSAFVRVMLNTDSSRNRFQIAAQMGGNVRYVMQGRALLTSSVTLPVTTIAVDSTASFPASGNLYVFDGSGIETSISYTGVSGNTLTGVSGGTAGKTYAANSPVFTTASTSGDWFEVVDVDNGGAQGIVQSAQAPLTQVFLNPTSYNVYSQTLRPNSSATAYQQIRNELGRVDLAWDNSGTAGAYSYQNGATVEGRPGTSTPAWRLHATSGAMQPGTPAGLGGRLFSGSGTPTIAGTAGDFYFRTDTPGTAGQRIYACTASGAAGAATWTATAA